MKNDASFQDAKRLYLEQYGDPMVTNTYLKIALTLACHRRGPRGSRLEDHPHVSKFPAARDPH